MRDASVVAPASSTPLLPALRKVSEGEVKIVAVNDTPDVIEDVQIGTIQATVVQKREAFAVRALRFLDEINHPSSDPMVAYAKQGLPMAPSPALFGAAVVNQRRRAGPRHRLGCPDPTLALGG